MIWEPYDFSKRLCHGAWVPRWTWWPIVLPAVDLIAAFSCNLSACVSIAGGRTLV
jgi:hypothetical protein